MKALKQFCEQSHVDNKMIRAVVRQSGGWRSFQQHAPDIAHYGISGGFDGWIYYTETCTFYAKNQKMIVDLVEKQAIEYDYTSAQDMVRKFRNLDATMSEIGYTLYGTERQHDNHVANALAWYAAEEVACAYADWTRK